jgi:hypothetical protein
MLSSKNEKGKEEVILNTPTQLWNFLIRLEKEKNNENKNKK